MANLPPLSCRRFGVPRLDDLADRIRELSYRLAPSSVVPLPPPSLPASISADFDGQDCRDWLSARHAELAWVWRSCGGEVGARILTLPGVGSRKAAQAFARDVIAVTIGASDVTKAMTRADVAAALLLAIEGGVAAIEREALL